MHWISVAVIFFASTAYKPFFEFTPSWRFVYNQTSLSSWLPVVTVITMYYFYHYYRNRYVIGVPVLGKIMKNYEAHPFRNYCIVHNAFLSGASLVLFTILATIILKSYREHGFYYIICSRCLHEIGMYSLVVYANYLLKYYELIDTFLIVFKKKPVDNLHFYHHAATLFLTYTQQVYHSSVQWVPILVNLFIHIIMYYYYMLCSMGYRNIWWKKSLTILQIAQFVVDLIACWGAWAILRYNHNACHGSDLGAIIGVSIITSYLFLFIDFFKRTYNRVTAGKPKKE